MTDYTDEWVKILQQKNIKILNDLFKQTNKMRKNITIYPKKEDVFKVFKITNLQTIKVIIIGQGPYHGKNQATGLTFAVNNETKAPPSLINIKKLINKCYNNKESLKTNDLTNWTDQGVLLLNTSLTVETGKPASHASLGWQEAI